MENLLYAVSLVSRRGKYFRCTDNTYTVGIENDQFIYRGYLDPLIIEPENVTEFIIGLEARFAPKSYEDR